TVAAASSSSAPAAASSSSAAASTPLMIAASLGDFQMVKYLVESGVDITIKDNLGRTALDVAKGALGVEVNPIKKSQYQLIVKYLSNPVTHTCHVIAQRQLEETFKMPTVLRDIIGEYLTGPTEDKRIINEINTALATKDLSGLAKLLDQNPDAACVADEEKNTPLVLAVRDNYQEAIPLIIQHLKNYRDKQLKDFDKQLTDIEKQEREANESIRKHEKILDALALQIPTAMLESEKNDAQAAYDSELAQDKQKREEYIEKSRKLSLEQERINREVSEVRRAFDTELDKAKELAKRLGYQDILELLQAYSPSHGQQATASSSSAAASSSSCVAPMEQGY
ncbi:MAG: ankyrin repeat domain-containing protein, partial [Candidatus Babeliales bacterium]|nr:ankyrin repeat domain-containing protein [Candidatus Babeliales bacterium]